MIPDAPREIFIDALNLAYWRGNPPSLRVPLSALAHLLRLGWQPLLVFDASARYRLEAELPVYEAVLAHGGAVLVAPSGRSADQLLLKQASARGAAVLSRDKYREFRKRYRKLIDDPQRLLTGTVLDLRLHIPALALDAPLFASADVAWAEAEPLLSTPHRALAAGESMP